MDAQTIQALAHLSSAGVWSIFWFSFFNHVAEILAVVAVIWGVRSWWVWWKNQPPSNKTTRGKQ